MDRLRRWRSAPASESYVHSCAAARVGFGVIVMIIHANGLSFRIGDRQRVRSLRHIKGLRQRPGSPDCGVAIKRILRLAADDSMSAILLSDAEKLDYDSHGHLALLQRGR
jgi:hypothetical protein